VRDLAGGGFLAQQHNAVLVGGTGTGKTHLVIAIAAAAFALAAAVGSTTSSTSSTGSKPRPAMVPFRKAYPQSIIDLVEVDDNQIGIRGSKDVLERAVLTRGAIAAESSQMSSKWRGTADEDGHYSFAVPL
jgi:predicted ATPase